MRYYEQAFTIFIDVIYGTPLPLGTERLAPQLTSYSAWVDGKFSRW